MTTFTPGVTLEAYNEQTRLLSVKTNGHNVIFSAAIRPVGEGD